MERAMERGVELEAVIDGLLKNYLSHNLAARVLQAGLDEVGVGFRPVVDHLTIRTLDIDRRAEEFLRLGYKIGRAPSELQSPYDLVCRLLLEKKKPDHLLAPQQDTVHLRQCAGPHAAALRPCAR